jgi:hypothetical protein
MDNPQSGRSMSFLSHFLSCRNTNDDAHKSFFGRMKEKERQSQAAAVSPLVYLVLDICKHLIPGRIGI